MSFRKMKVKIVTGAVALAVAGVLMIFEGNPNFEKFAAQLGNTAGISVPYSGVNPDKAPGAQELSGVDVPYDRDLYEHWIDANGDCKNARHELLQELSTAAVKMNSSGCTVATGRWNDPYTGNIYTVARDLDIDHMVPLAWAHWHGAHSWDAEKRRKFANDPVNLFAVQASANRQKGARGPLDWLPPDATYHCAYITRFHRIVLIYDLQYSADEGQQMDALRARLCA